MGPVEAQVASLSTATAALSTRVSNVEASLSTIDASRITTGTIGPARLPIGTGPGNVAAGNHTHAFSELTGVPAGIADGDDVGLPLTGGTVTGNVTVNGTLNVSNVKTAGMNVGATMLYARGTGLNNIANNVVVVGSNRLERSGRGLTLTIINSNTQTVVSDTTYDTWGSTAAADALATALNGMNGSQIGILTSYDTWGISANLVSAANNRGLLKLAGNASPFRHPYAAIFRGGTANQHVVEVMQSNDSNAPRATIATWLVEDTFIGQSY